MSGKTLTRVAGAVFKESVRDRVPFAMVVFAVVLMGASFLMSRLTGGQDLKVIKDLGLATMNMIGLLIAIFIGTGLVAKEVERRSIYGVITKPLTRETFILGKYAGLVVTLAVNLATMSVAYFAVLAYYDATTDDWIKSAWRAPAIDPWLLVPVMLIGVQLMLTTAVALFFSTFSGPLLAVLFTLGIWVAGHFSADLKNFQEAVDAPAAVWLARVLYYALPNLAALDVKNEVVHNRAIAWPALGFGVLGAMAHIGVFLAAAVAVFRRRDFK
jgi:Cu-processing system permease protein